MTKVNTTFYGWSWGEVQFEWTTVGPFKTSNEYKASNCASYDIGSEAGAKNILGAAAVQRELNIDVSSYDFQMYWQPVCADSPFSGIAYVGGVQGLMNSPDASGGTVDSWAKVLAHPSPLAP